MTQLRASQFLSKSTGSSCEVCPGGTSSSGKCFSPHRDLKQHSASGCFQSDQNGENYGNSAGAGGSLEPQKLSHST